MSLLVVASASLSLLLSLAQDPAPPTRIRVGGNVQAANLIKKVTPVYPALAKQARIQGTVRFTVIIAKDGSIANMQLVSGHPLLVPAATEAVQQWTYKPTLLNGNPVEVITQIDINFSLSEDVTWAVSWQFLSKFGGDQVELEESDMNKPARLLADGSLTGGIGEKLKAARFRPMTLDGAPFEPTVWLTKSMPGSPDVVAGWKQMEARILARRDAVKPNDGAQGKVFVEVVVNGDGNVERIVRASGPEALLESAKQAARDWRFRPVVINGMAFSVRTAIPFEF